MPAWSRLPPVPRPGRESTPTATPAPPAGCCAAGGRLRAGSWSPNRCSAWTATPRLWPRLAEAAADTDSILVVDEAHALGVLGPGGRGLCAAAGVSPDVLIGTLGKAVGTAGGFVAGAPALRDLLVNRARTFIFTTALPPPVAAAAAAAVRLARGSRGRPPPRPPRGAARGPSAER